MLLSARAAGRLIGGRWARWLVGDTFGRSWCVGVGVGGSLECFPGFARFAFGLRDGIGGAKNFYGGRDGPNAQFCPRPGAGSTRTLDQVGRARQEHSEHLPSAESAHGILQTSIVRVYNQIPGHGNSGSAGAWPSVLTCPDHVALATHNLLSPELMPSPSAHDFIQSSSHIYGLFSSFAQ